MFTSPVTAARAVVATGAWVKSKHDMYLTRKVWELELYFYPSAGGFKKKREKKKTFIVPTLGAQGSRLPPDKKTREHLQT